jgi:hypothetical protein
MVDFKNVASFGVTDITLQKPYVQFLKKSLAVWPREWLMSSLKDDGPLGYDLYRTLSNEMFGEGVSVDVYRSIYITKYLEGNPTIKEREKLAKMMLHTIESQSLFYRKVDEEKEAVELPLPNAVKKEVRKEVAEEVKQGSGLNVEALKKIRAERVAERRGKKKEYSKEYYQKNGSRIREQQADNFQARKHDVYRRRIINQVRDELAAGITPTVRLSTLERYNVVDTDFK